MAQTHLNITHVNIQSLVQLYLNYREVHSNRVMVISR